MPAPEAATTTDDAHALEAARLRALERVENDLAAALAAADEACAGAIALAGHVLAARGRAAPDGKARFLALEQEGLIDARLRGALVTAAGLNNLVTRQCQPSEPAMIALAIRQAMADLEGFARLMAKAR
jgi:uncharacterized protein YutE (UPF0331/DUF86 family)